MSQYAIEQLNPEPMIKWMRERQRIFRRRQAGAMAPFTDDPILRKYRFCQVFREHDYVTAWIRENWRVPYANHPKIPFAMAVARYFNEPTTLELLTDLVFPDMMLKTSASFHVGEAIRRCRERAKVATVFRAAYIISPCGSTKPKIERVLEDYLNPVWNSSEEWIVPESLQKTHFNICNGNEGFGAFMGYEVVSDLRHTAKLKGAYDIMTWANPGPGAQRGLLRLLGKKGADVRKSLPEDFKIKGMQYLLTQASVALRFEDRMFQKLEMRDIENALCETDKYLRAATGEGSPKQQWQWSGK